ncbi:hypothetical protein [Pseudoxanthomonas winnipegensis]|uniref:Uncharacterized protein n=1 Tax=Pseudoxanthomonas winnipegensis TaxID=2480810 RepID=A0A4Q8M0L5_9GAMM|nr:hypothetical protein [Pseudoxanthomonas winnipegensis]RZZ86919.1 hypothetical protein EA663_08570 [Pseudoxanthomonas winnipegensis]TAA37865.1 hypothetical protein EA656_04220 [Pseudoxanthomonas winnipegensis]
MGVMLAVTAAMPLIARADYEIPPFVMPPASQLKVASKIGLREPVSFRGQEQVSGDLLAEWQQVGSNGIEASYSIVPDAPSAARLPHFEGYGIRVIDLSNGEAALAMMLGDAQAQRLILDRHMKRVRIHGTFVITDYEMSFECDVPWAKARVLTTERASAVADVPELAGRC